MLTEFITNANAYVGGKFVLCNIKIIDGKIKGIMPLGETYGPKINIGGKMLIPGFIDVGAHSLRGEKSNINSLNELIGLRDALAKHGVTGFCPAITTDAFDIMSKTAELIGRAKSSETIDEIVGVHLEGPFISPEYATDKQRIYLKHPDYAIVSKLNEACGGLIRLITLAPELPDTSELIRKICMDDIRISLGFTNASYEATADAFKWGAVSATNILNNMPKSFLEGGNVTSGILESDCFCTMSFDTDIIDPAVMRLLVKIKGEKRIVAASGSYYKGHPLSDNEERPNTAFADDMLKSAVHNLELPLEKILPFFTENPAKLLGIWNKKGSIEVGKDADFTILNKDLTVDYSICRGDRII